MSNFSSETISVRSAVRRGVLALLSLTLLVASVSFSIGRTLANRIQWADHSHEVRSTLTSIEADLMKSESAARAFLYTGQAESLRDYALTSGLPAQCDALCKLEADNSAQLARARRLKEMMDQKIAFMDQCLTLKKNHQEADLNRLVATRVGANLTLSIHHAVSELEGVAFKLLETRRGSVASAGGLLNTTLLLGLVCSLGLALTLLQFLGRRLAPLGDSVKLAERIGGGNLGGTPVVVPHLDEVGQVNSALNKMLQQLRQGLSEDRRRSQVIDEASSRLALSTSSQAAAVQQQSSALLQTSTTLEELTRSAQQIVDTGQTVAERAGETARSAGTGVQAVRQSSRATLELVDQVETAASRIEALG